jgi:hypothetical protein
MIDWAGQRGLLVAPEFESRSEAMIVVVVVVVVEVARMGHWLPASISHD